MPIYEFICRDCECVEEHIMKISDPSPTSCQRCGKPTLEKMLSRTNFVLKGNGWYETDFKEKPKTKDKQKEAKTPAKNKEHSTTKPESSSTATKAEPQQATQATTK